MTDGDREMLVEMHTDIKWIKETLTDHLKSHLTWGVTVVGAIASVCGGCLIYHFTH